MSAKASRLGLSTPYTRYLTGKGNGVFTVVVNGDVMPGDSCSTAGAAFALKPTAVVDTTLTFVG